MAITATRPTDSHPPMPSPRSRSRLFAHAALLGAGLIIYLSLLPFSYNGLSLGAGWDRFLHMRWVDLDTIGRADWIANILLYVPVAFAGAGWRSANDLFRHRRLTDFLTVWLACLALAILVEFLQAFFSPRTVSLNDLGAEAIGSFLGILLWFYGRIWLIAIWHDLRAGGTTAIRAAGLLYLLGYGIAVLFPYDIPISATELEAKWDSPQVGWLMADAGCADGLRCALRLLLEVLGAFPLGVILGLTSIPTRVGHRLVWLLGLMLGASLEFLQLFLISGVSQGLSILTCAVGLSLGFSLFRWITMPLLYRLEPYVTRGVWFLALPYLWAVLFGNGWFSAPWLSQEAAAAQLAKTSFLPFYYHYRTTETAAGFSVLAIAFAYGLIGVGVWLWSRGAARAPSVRGAGLIALILAVVVETGKLWLPEHHPDFTNPLIGSLAAASAVIALDWLARQWRVHSTRLPGPGAPEPPWTLPARRSFIVPWHSLTRGLGFLPQAMALVLALVLILVLWRYPVARWELGMGLIAYVVLLAYRPAAWLLVIPALVPALDLTPWSGWFYWEAADFFLAATLGMALWRGVRPRSSGATGPLLRVLVALLGVSYGIGVIQGLLPLEPLEPDATAGYFSHYNSLRMAKGLFWVLALLPLLQRELADRYQVTTYLLPGVALGFALVTLAILSERLAFAGIFDFAHQFRVTATFSSMHTGGNYLEAYLVLTLPLLASAIFLYADWRARALGLVLLALGTYGLLVTFARSGVLGLTAAVLILILGVSLAYLKGGRHDARRHLGLLGAILTILGVVGLPILHGDFFQHRFAMVRHDLATRAEHWREGVGMMRPGALTTLFGMGLGRFPETYLLHNPRDIRLASFQLLSEGNNRFLRLSGGDPLYYEQRVDLEPERTYELTLEARTHTPGAQLQVWICAKAMLYSQDCRRLSVKDLPADGRWQIHSFAFASGSLGADPWYARRPIKLSLFNRQRDTSIDVDKLRLSSGGGPDLLHNGDFSRGYDHWFFATDNLEAFHLSQLGVQMYFDQGLVGAGTFLIFLTVVLALLWHQVRQGDILATGLLAGLTGFLVTGLFDSLFDAPVLSLMFYFLAFSALILPRARPGLAEATANPGSQPSEPATSP